MSIDLTSLEIDLTSLLKEFVATLKLEETATISVKRDPEEGTDFRIEPLDETRAGFWINYVDNVRWISVSTGKNTVLEIPIEGEQYSDKAGIEELLGILRAIVLNGMQEEVWMHGEKIVKSIGTLHVEGESQPTVVKCYSLHNPFASTTKLTTQYLPYSIVPASRDAG